MASPIQIPQPAQSKPKEEKLEFSNDKGTAILKLIPDTQCKDERTIYESMMKMVDGLKEQIKDQINKRK